MSRGSWEHEIDEQTLTWLEQNAAKIGSVVKHIERDDEGITYSVFVHYDFGGTFAEVGDDERGIWQRIVLFGKAEASRAGGYFFKVAAEDQDEIAEVIWRRHRDAT